MNPIELCLWESDLEKPGYLRYVGQPVAENIFHELESRLRNSGMLPDEYFLMDSAWKNGREIPPDACVFCTTDYGESEGIYVDVYLKWYENRQPVTQSFATGKTLGETGYDMDRMFLIASAITKAFSGYGYGNEEAKGMVVQLNNAERNELLLALSQVELTPARQAAYQKLAPELTRKDLRIGEDIEVSDTGGLIEVYLETWFDVDRKFNAHTNGHDDKWVNLYAEYNPTTDQLSMYYVIESDTDLGDQHDYSPTLSEASLVKELIAGAIKERYGQTPLEFVESALDEPDR